MKKYIPQKKLREFGLVIGFGFPILIGWILPSIGGHLFRLWTLWIAIPSLIIGIIKPRLLLFPYQGWMALGHSLGWINSRIILGLVYILILLPIAFIMRAFGHDPLRKKWDRSNTYREINEDHQINLTRIF